MVHYFKISMTNPQPLPNHQRPYIYIYNTFITLGHKLCCISFYSMLYDHLIPLNVRLYLYKVLFLHIIVLCFFFYLCNKLFNTSCYRIKRVLWQFIVYSPILCIIFTFNTLSVLCECYMWVLPNAMCNKSIYCTINFMVEGLNLLIISDGMLSSCRLAEASGTKDLVKLFINNNLTNISHQNYCIHSKEFHGLLKKGIMSPDLLRLDNSELYTNIIRYLSNQHFIKFSKDNPSALQDIFRTERQVLYFKNKDWASKHGHIITIANSNMCYDKLYNTHIPYLASLNTTPYKIRRGIPMTIMSGIKENHVSIVSFTEGIITPDKVRIYKVRLDYPYLPFFMNSQTSEVYFSDYSLSSKGLHRPYNPDTELSDSVKESRNNFLCNESILQDELRAIGLRLTKDLEDFSDSKYSSIVKNGDLWSKVDLHSAFLRSDSSYKSVTKKLIDNNNTLGDVLSTYAKRL